MSGAPNLGRMVEERVLRTIATNLEDRNEATVRHAEAIGMTPEEMLRGADPDDLEKILIRLYADPAEDRASGIEGFLPAVRNMRSHPIGTAILEGLGIDPRDLAFLSSWSGESASVDLPGGICAGLYWVKADNRTAISFHVGNDILWEHDGYERSEILLGLPVPDTLKPSLPGMRLRDVVSHPVLDRIDMVIEGWEDAAEGDILIQLSPLGRKLPGKPARPADAHTRLAIAPLATRDGTGR